VVFLHGGPGIADLAGGAAYFGQLTGDGYDVFIYDRVGTGRSNRLQDPRGSAIAREVADLEAIRQQIRADRLVLIGHSWADPWPALAGLATPALVLKGSCDYLSWGTAIDYRHALPQARLVYLHHAGHNAYRDQPATYLTVVRAFLTGRPLPIPPRTGDNVPADYQGPP
jgi:pimeloyl-ACP methyl ester carboxylesterase